MTGIAHGSNRRLFWVGAGLMLVYYFADSAMDALLFGEDSVREQLFSPSPHELAIRVLSSLFLFTFFLFARHLLKKNQLLQEKLLSQTRELIASKQEREAFTHSVSNELRSSLTCIYLAEQTFTELHGRDLNEQGRSLIGHIHDTCEKMSEQINKILDLSKVIRADLDCQQIELNKLALAVADEVRQGMEDMTLCMETENHMAARCDPELMRLAIKSLCMNIIEYCKPDGRADITMGTAAGKDDKQTFFIRNNSQTSRRDIRDHQFALFGIRSEARKLPGGCVYLNVAEAVIQRHGGSLWTRSAPEFGSTIFFSV